MRNPHVPRIVFLNVLNQPLKYIHSLIYFLFQNYLISSSFSHLKPLIGKYFDIAQPQVICTIIQLMQLINVGLSTLEYNSKSEELPRFNPESFENNSQLIIKNYDYWYSSNDSFEIF